MFESVFFGAIYSVGTLLKILGAMPKNLLPIRAVYRFAYRAYCPYAYYA